MFEFLKNVFLGKPVESQTDGKMQPEFDAVPPETDAPVATAPSETPSASRSRSAPASNGNGGSVDISLQAVLSGFPLELKGRIMQSDVGGATVSLPLEKVLSQLTLGSVKITFGELRRAAPQLFAPGSDRDQVQVALPLHEILGQIDPALLPRRQNQRQLEVIPDEVRSPFGDRGNGLIFSVGPGNKTETPAPPARSVTPAAAPRAPAAPARSVTPAPSAPTQATPLPPSRPAPAPKPAMPNLPPVPSAPARGSITPIPPTAKAPSAPPPIPFPPTVRPAGAAPISPIAPSGPMTPGRPPGPITPITPARPPTPPLARTAPTPPAVPAPAPITPIARSTPAAAISPIAPSVPRPAAPVPPPARPAPAPEGPSLSVPLMAMAEGWPEAIRQEIVQSKLLDARIALPVEMVEQALKRGKVAFTWKALRSWLRPPPLNPTSAHDNTGLDLPLKVLAPLFLTHQQNAGRSQQKVAIDENIPNLFFGFPQPGAPAPAAAVAAAAAPETPPPASPVVTKASDTNFYNWDDNADAPKATETELKRRSSPGTNFVTRCATPNEVVSRAAALDGVAGALIALPDGLMVASRLAQDLNGDTLAAFLPQIFSKVSQCTKELRMGELNNLNFTVGNVPWKIFRVNAIFFAAFGRPGQPLPTAQLVALASELDRKKQ